METIKIHCHTNLDLHNEEWPTELPCRPMVGDYITSKTKHPQYNRDINGFSLGGLPTHFWSLELQICDIRFLSDNNGNYFCKVELSMKKHLQQSIKDFYVWYAPLVGKRVSSFI